MSAHPLQIFMAVVLGVPASFCSNATRACASAVPTGLATSSPTASAAARVRLPTTRGSLLRLLLPLVLRWHRMHMRCRPSSSTAFLQNSDRDRTTPHLLQGTSRVSALPQ